MSKQEREQSDSEIDLFIDFVLIASLEELLRSCQHIGDQNITAEHREGICNHVGDIGSASSSSSGRRGRDSGGRGRAEEGEGAATGGAPETGVALSDHSGLEIQGT